METPEPTYVEPTFEPSAAQLERDKELRRRNRLYIYLPFGFVALLSIITILLILIGVFAPGITGTEEFIAALADIIIILWIIPVILLLAVLPILYVAYLVNRRNKRKLDPQTGPLAYRSRVQILLWRVQYFVEKSQTTTNKYAPKVAEPVTRFNSLIAYLEAWLDAILSPIRGSKNKDRIGNGDS
ncbi:MAG: hypothetical protein R3293_18880 [Candidatus Promineifilaceae bacterium]|nr:hypothetical protein [Candidatus Promineifilaceae bacterium]